MSAVGEKVSVYHTTDNSMDNKLSGRNCYQFKLKQILRTYRIQCDAQIGLSKSTGCQNGQNMHVISHESKIMKYRTYI